MTFLKPSSVQLLTDRCSHSEALPEAFALSALHQLFPNHFFCHTQKLQNILQDLLLPCRKRSTQEWGKAGEAPGAPAYSLTVQLSVTSVSQVLNAASHTSSGFSPFLKINTLEKHGRHCGNCYQRQIQQKSLLCKVIN